MKRDLIRQGAARLLRAVRGGGEDFAAALGVTYEEGPKPESLALETSVLLEVDSEQFASTVIELGRRDQDLIVGALYARLKRGFPGERDWVKKVTEILRDKNSGPSLQNHMLRMRLSRLVE
jgi:hypothetical protein